MKLKKIVSLLLATIILFSVMSIPNIVYAGQTIAYYKGLPIDNPLHITASVPAASTNGCAFDDKYWVHMDYRVIVYGSPSSVPGNEGPTYNKNLGTYEYRYLGFDSAGNKFSNERYPDDADLGVALADKAWIFEPWNAGLCIATDYSKSPDCTEDINEIAEKYGFTPGGGSFFGYGNVQSYPTLLAPGSFRMWHLYNGSYWYQTFEIPKKTLKLDAPFKVTTEVLSSDFTIDESETTVDVSVKVTAKLDDDIIYNDDIKRALNYNRTDIKEWALKVEYKGTETYVVLSPDGTNTATNTFNIKLSRSQLVDMEKVIFNGVARVTFHNDKYYRDSDPKTAQFKVAPALQELPPDVSVAAPAKVNIKESYTVRVNTVIPLGESIKSLVLEGSVNGGAYLPIFLSGNSVSQRYDSISIINYRAIITLNNNKTASSTALTNVVDGRSSDATAKIEQPGTAYEGHWLTVGNRNIFTFEGSSYNAQQASDLGIGYSYFEIQDNSQYPLSGNLFQIRNYDGNTGFDIRYMQSGLYKNTIYAAPRNGSTVTDTRGIQILRCPAIIASVDGTKKSNRRMTLDFSRTVAHPDYPLVSSKTYAIIEDTVTGEKVTVTNSVHPDSTNIKTNALSGNKMDFLIKTAVDRVYTATVYVEDLRGNSDTESITFTVARDLAPVAKISAKAQELRKPSLSNKAEIFLQDDSYSEDGDYVTRTWEIALDTDNDGLFTDQTYTAVNLLDGYQDLSDDASQKKVRFLKTGVGKLDARVRSKEVFAQPTIGAFVTSADRMEATTTRTADVLNVSPIVDFKIFKNIATTINLIAGSLSSSLETSVQNSIARLQSQLLANKITPVINYVPVSLDTSRPVWNQDGGNSQRTGKSRFNGIINTDLKWMYTSDVALNDTVIEKSALRITPEGNLLVRLYSNVTHIGYLRLLNKQGVLLKSAALPSGTVSGGSMAVLSDGRILIKKDSKNIIVYDKNLNLVSTYMISSSRQIQSAITVDNNDRIYFVAWQYDSILQQYNSYLYILNSDLTVKVSTYVNWYDNYSSIRPNNVLVDSTGNSYFGIRNTVYKYDVNGKKLWGGVNSLNPELLDESADILYGSYNYTNASNISYYRLYKVNMSTGAVIKYREFQASGGLLNFSMNDTEIFAQNADSVRLLAFKKSDLTRSTDLGGVGWEPEKAVISADGQIFSWAGTSTDASIFRSSLNGGARIYFNSYNGTSYAVSSAVFSSDNTLYLAVAYYYRTAGSYNYDYVNGNMFIMAYGTVGTEQNTDNTLRKINGYIPDNSTVDFTVSITDAPYQDNADADITNTANLLKNKNDRLLMIGNASSKPDGQKILNKGVPGSLYDIDANMGTPLTGAGNYIINSLVSPDQKVYEYYYNKGEIVNYDVFYTDYELDPSKSSQWRYYHTPETDGTIADNGVWLNSPKTRFTKNGTYRVQHRQADNTGVGSYDRYSNIIELVIFIEDGTVMPPPLSYTPEANIELEGCSKQNRKLTLKLNYSANNALPLRASTISWTLTPVSGMSAADIKKSSLAAQNIDTLYKKSGRVRATCAFRDTNGNQGSTTAEFDVAADLAPTGTLQTSPVVYRNNGGVAAINVKADVTSPDDYIASLKYYITYDADNNGSFLNDTKAYLPQYENLREFNIDVNTGVGSYLIQLDVKEGYREPTIPAYIGAADYPALALQAASGVDNIAPVYDVRPEKDVYLVGEYIRFKAYDGSYLNGDASKGFFDTEKDTMTGFSIKYMQNRAVMPSQDSTSAYHNQLGAAFINSLDRAGEYTVDINAYDDPKDGDIRFEAYKKSSNTSSNKIIVHRRPTAALSFASSHAASPVFDFGGNMYLDGTRLEVADASTDPDGFNVTSSISYKVDSGDYTQLDSGDAINLYYGSVFTVKVVSTDNWGADDTALYTFSVINDLDMIPEVIPSSVAAGENVMLRLTTNQYATGARAVIFGQSADLALISRTATEKVWETGYSIPAAGADAIYAAQFYAVSEGSAEIRKDKEFQVMTPINLVPGMPAEVVSNTDIIINAATSKYANTTTVRLFQGTAYEAALSMNGVVNDGSKNWTADYTVPAGIPAGNYTARFTSTTPNGNIEIRDVSFRVESLKITGVTISGYWNHWRGQVDMFGKQMSIEPHRLLSLEKVKIDVYTSGYADKVDVRFSPALESMQFTDQDGNEYDYFLDYGLQYVYFPASFTLDSGLQDNHLHWEYTLPLAPSTVGWDDMRKKPQYTMTVTAWKGEYSVAYSISDIDITGNIYDQAYIQPID